MSNSKITFKFLNNQQFTELYCKLMGKQDLSEEELTKILSIAIILLNNEDENIKRLGYRIVVTYCNFYNQYEPLYEIAINKGLYPISKFIDSHYIKDYQKDFFTEWNDCYTKQYQENDIVQTSQQKCMNRNFKKYYSNSLALVAPTSYGKSELINKLIDENKGKKICIVTTTKALLAQTRKRIKDSKVLGTRKIITNSEMFHNGMENFVAVLTQERLNRLLKVNKSFSFDYLLIDEAHELLDDNPRSRMLARAIIILKHRNNNCIFKFLTPFILDPQNLKTKYTSYNLKQITITEYLKTEKYYIHELKTEKYLFYDQFLNQTWTLNENINNSKDEDIVINYSGRKNIIYLNKPKDVEDFAYKLSKKLPAINSEQISEACKNLEKYVHSDYRMIECLKRGVIYHHGSVPDSVRAYVENLYKNLADIKYIVTTSTLLSGVNLPATHLFLLDIKKGRSRLTLSSFRNLIGRICRFNQIFNERNGSLKLLEPQIHIVVGKYMYKNANIKKFLEQNTKVDKKYKDDVENVLLRNTNTENTDELRKEKEYLENFQEGTIEDYSNRVIRTEVGHACIMNDITDFDIFEYEEEMQKRFEKIRKEDVRIDNISDLMTSIRRVLLFPITDLDNELYKLNDDGAKNFYSMMLKWKIENQTFSEMVNSVVNYWNILYENNHDVTIYAGRWGNVSTYDGRRQTNRFSFKEENYQSIVNLAIVRVKEEQDFIGNSIMKYVEVLNDLQVLEQNFYLKVKYGTDNPNMVCMLKNGFSLNIAHLLLNQYSQYLSIDLTKDEVVCSPKLIDAMEEQKENPIQILEVKSYI